jgi:hypothetical protein
VEELGCYFVELEALYDQHAVTTDTNKKQGALKYHATVVLKITWRASNTYTDVMKNYEDFKNS